MDSLKIIDVPQKKRYFRIILSFFGKLLICATAISTITGAFVIRIITDLEYKKRPEEVIILIEDYSAPTAIAYYDRLYENSKKKKTESKNEEESTGKRSVEDGKKALVAINLYSETTGMINETEYTPDLEQLLATPVKLPYFTRAAVQYTGSLGNTETEQPLVLILHTHGTESYAAENEFFYESDYAFRSSDITENIVAVGAVMAEILNKNGIPALHCETMHDKESYLNSYNRAAETIAYYINKYPSIICVLDIHRDALANANGEIMRPVTSVERNGSFQTAAQIMSVVGTDFRGAIHPDWENNLSFALKLQYSLHEKYGSLARPINLRGAAFNQQYAPVSLLLEIGSTGNTLSEAKRSAQIVSETLADILIGICHLEP